MVFLDFENLSKYIIELSEEYKKLDRIPDMKEIPLFGLYDNILTDLITNIISFNIISKDDLWKRYGINVYKYNDEMDGCMCKGASGVPIGSGAFGTVYKTNVDNMKCMSKSLESLPLSKPIAVKKEDVQYYQMLSTPKRLFLYNPARIAQIRGIYKKAAELGIGPKLYDIFVCVDERLMIIELYKVMEFLEGTTFGEFIVKYPTKKQEAIEKLRGVVRLANKQGIAHRDLNDGNIMVQHDGEVIEKIYLMDFDLSTYGINEQIELNKYMINEDKIMPENNKLVSPIALNYIKHKLISENYIKLKSLSKGKTRKMSKRNVTRGLTRTSRKYK